MQPGINIDAVKQYNASLREYKEKSSKLRAEIEFNQKELDRQCQELSTELGVQVTPDNIKSILEERIAKINNTIAVGTEILDRIKSEEKVMASGQAVSQPNPQSQAVNNIAPGPAAPGFVPQTPSAPGVPNINDLMSGGLPPILQNKGIQI